MILLAARMVLEINLCLLI